MKNFAALVLAVLAAFAPGLRAQEDGHAHPDVPQAQVAEAAKPFRGDWNAVVCQPKPYGVRFNIRLGDVKDEKGNDNITPIFHLVAVQIMDIGEPFDFTTVSFKFYADKPVLVVTNNQLEVGLFPGDPGLWLDVEDDNGGVSAGFAEKGDDAKDPWAYVEKLSQSCPAPEKTASNRPQYADATRSR